MSEQSARIPTFQEFWPFYVSQHLKSGTRTPHFLGTSLGLLLFAAAVITAKPFLILWALVASYGLAWIAPRPPSRAGVTR